MKVELLKKLQISTLVLCFIVPNVSAVIQLNSPSEFSNPSTVLNFDDGVHLQAANILYQSQGVVFSRDDGQGVAIYDLTTEGKSTTSSPNVLATIGVSLPSYPATTWVTHLNADFVLPVYEVGAYFGNDQSSASGFNMITLMAYGKNKALLGSIIVNTNNNSSVDQFIGLSSTEAIYSVRFQNSGEWLAVEIDDFQFSPIPEPATISLLALGAFLVGRRRK